MNEKNKFIYDNKYTDLGNNLHNINHSVIYTDEERRELEDKIANELYKIFTHKNS